MKYRAIGIGMFIVISLSYVSNVRCSMTRNHNINNFQDTIKKPCVADDCDSRFNGYFYFNGVVISDYYELTDSITIDLNGDKVNDYIIVITPKSITPPYVEYCQPKSFDNYIREVVELLSNGDKYIIGKRYNNLVTNTGGILSKYGGIYKTENGFKIIHSTGSRYVWEYTMFFIVKHNALYLSKISRRCSYDDIEEITNYQYIDYPIKLININDTIKNNCNCDSIWMKMSFAE